MDWRKETGGWRWMGSIPYLFVLACPDASVAVFATLGGGGVWEMTAANSRQGGRAGPPHQDRAWTPFEPFEWKGGVDLCRGLCVGMGLSGCVHHLYSVGPVVTSYGLSEKQARCATAANAGGRFLSIGRARLVYIVILPMKSK